MSPAGFEPATPALGKRCSIQLSYEDLRDTSATRQTAANFREDGIVRYCSGHVKMLLIYSAGNVSGIGWSRQCNEKIPKVDAAADRNVNRQIQPGEE